jgi:hypothetical protein
MAPFVASAFILENLPLFHEWLAMKNIHFEFGLRGWLQTQARQHEGIVALAKLLPDSMAVPKATLNWQERGALLGLHLAPPPPGPSKSDP